MYDRIFWSGFLFAAVAINIFVPLAPGEYGSLWPFACVFASMVFFFFIARKSKIGAVVWYLCTALGITLFGFLSNRPHMGREIMPLYVFCIVVQLAYENRSRSMLFLDAKSIQGFLTDVESVLAIGLGTGVTIAVVREPNLSPLLIGLGMLCGIGQGVTVWLFKERNALLLPAVFGLALVYVAVVFVTHQATPAFAIGFGVCTLVLAGVDGLRRLNATVVIATERLARS